MNTGATVLTDRQMIEELATCGIEPTVKHDPLIPIVVKIAQAISVNGGHDEALAAAGVIGVLSRFIDLTLMPDCIDEILNHPNDNR